MLQPGDCLEIRCGEDPRLCVSRSVSLNGVVAVPELGTVAAVEMTVTRLSERIQKLFWDRKGIVREVDVRFSTSQGMVRVEGLLVQPFSRNWVAGLGLRELLRDASFQEAAERRFIDIDDANGNRIEIDVAVADAVLRPGDRVLVGRSRSSNQVVVVGPVAHPGAFDAIPGMTLTKAIELSGGFSGHADGKHINIKRADGTSTEVDISTAGNTVLYRGDEVSVGVSEEQLFVSVAGAVSHPGVVEFRTGMRLSEAVVAAGGLIKGRSDVVVVKRILDKQMRSATYHLNRILAKLDDDPVLQPSDSITVGGTKR